MPLLPSLGQLYSMWSLKSSNLRVVLRLAPLDSLSSSPSLATQWLAAAPMGSQPVRSLPLKSGSGLVQAVGMGRFSAGERTPSNCADTVPPRLTSPLNRSPLEVNSHTEAGPRPPSMVTISLPPSSFTV